MPRVTQKGQVTIPKGIRDELGIDGGDEVRFRRTDHGTVEVSKIARSSPFRKYKGALKHLRGKSSDEILVESRGAAE
jgi:AbrB family looped-hinge helix DNA binding protein